MPALSLLEQCLSYNPSALKLEDVEHIFGLTSTAEEVDLYLKIHEQKTSEVITKLREMYVSGADTKRLALDLLEIVKDVLIYSDQGREKLLTRITPAEAQDIINRVPAETLFKDVKELEALISKEKQSQSFMTYLELTVINMAQNGSLKKTEKEISVPLKEEKPVEEKAEEPKEEPKEEIKEEPIEEKPEPIPGPEKIQEVKEDPGMKVIEPDIDFLLAILLNANKDLKIADQIIYNKLELYAYEPEKRKFYQLLIGTDLFASNKDAIIVSGTKAQADNINTRSVNEALYRFINKEFGIDKMVYAIDPERKKELINMYRSAAKENLGRPVYVEKYNIEDKKEDTEEDKLRKLFGDKLKVEE